MVHAFHLRLAELSTRVWIEYVPTLANIADGPTRDEFELLHSVFHARVIEFVFPPLTGWSGKV